MKIQKIFSTQNLKDGWYFEWRLLACLMGLGMLAVPVSLYFILVLKVDMKRLDYKSILAVIAAVAFIFRWLVFSFYTKERNKAVSVSNNYMGLGAFYLWRWFFLAIPVWIVFILGSMAGGKFNNPVLNTIMFALRPVVFILTVFVSGYVYNNNILPKLKKIPLSKLKKPAQKGICVKCGAKNFAGTKVCLSCGSKIKKA